MEEPRKIHGIQDLDKIFTDDHMLEQTLAKIQKTITLKKPRIIKGEGSKINLKAINKEILYNLENKINPKMSLEIQEDIDIIINELDFNQYEKAFERLMDLIKRIEDSL